MNEKNKLKLAQKLLKARNDLGIAYLEATDENVEIHIFNARNEIDEAVYYLTGKRPSVKVIQR